jgi:hypothetical protein
MLMVMLEPSQAEIRLTLTGNENQSGLESGSISWLNNGINIEQAQYVHI